MKTSQCSSLIFPTFPKKLDIIFDRTGRDLTATVAEKLKVIIFIYYSDDVTNYCHQFTGKTNIKLIKNQIANRVWAFKCKVLFNCHGSFRLYFQLWLPTLILQMGVHCELTIIQNNKTQTVITYHFLRKVNRNISQFIQKYLYLSHVCVCLTFKIVFAV